MRTAAAKHRELPVFVIGSSAWLGCTSFSADVAAPADGGAVDDAGGAADTGPVDASPAALLLRDTFTRTQATGWGAAEKSGFRVFSLMTIIVSNRQPTSGSRRKHRCRHPRR